MAKIQKRKEKQRAYWHYSAVSCILKSVRIDFSGPWGRSLAKTRKIFSN